MSILDEIFANKRLEVAQRKSELSLTVLRRLAEEAPAPLDFRNALKRPERTRPRLIAEVKKASPSRGLLVKEFNPFLLAQDYRQNGAAAISVLTDQRYFQGSLDDLRIVAEGEPRLPALRKDFLFDPYQLFEARAAGASAVLLIAAMLDPVLLKDLRSQACEMGLSALIETHTPEEVESALRAGATIVGVNNRSLHDFSVDLATSHHLRSLIPSEIVMVAESGIHTRSDVDRLQQIGVDAILVGEALVTAADIPAKVRELAL